IAACKYFNVLYEIFGSWELALIAYNAGPTFLSETISEKQLDPDYHSLSSYLPIPARRYLPAMVAIIYLFENHEMHF
ncbi:MAG: transglycosylase SLT domain-containing protein, partial [Bacteroidota bacterium]